jgi:O-antigen biosynthesis protein
MSVKVLTIDLADPPEDLAGCDVYTALLALVRVKGHAIGWARVNHERQATVAGRWLQAEAARAVHWELLPYALLPDYAAPPAPTPPISVIVLSDGDPRALAECLEAVSACAYPAYELLVADYGAQPAAIRQVVAQWPAACYVRAARPGSGAARNQAAAAARYDLLAYLDATCMPDVHWLSAIAAGFSVADVAAVSGPIAPHALDTSPQRLFEEVCGGLGRDTYSRTVCAATAGISERIGGLGMGSGKNLALRRTTLHILGGFNPALGIGTPAGGGEDQELLVRLLARGLCVRYTGDALVWHAHPPDWHALGRMLFDRGRSRGAALLVTARIGVVGRGDLLSYAVFVWLRAILGRIRRPNGLPRRFAGLELLGALTACWST